MAGPRPWRNGLRLVGDNHGDSLWLVAHDQDKPSFPSRDFDARSFGSVFQDRVQGRQGQGLTQGQLDIGSVVDREVQLSGRGENLIKDPGPVVRSNGNGKSAQALEKARDLGPSGR